MRNLKYVVSTLIAVGFCSAYASPTSQNLRHFSIEGEHSHAENIKLNAGESIIVSYDFKSYPRTPNASEELLFLNCYNSAAVTPYGELPIHAQFAGESQGMDEQDYTAFQAVSDKHPKIGERFVDNTGHYYVIQPNGELIITNISSISSIMDCNFKYFSIHQ